MTTTRATRIAGTADHVFLALGQTAYASQLFEATMLEVLATANELLGGAGDGRTFQASLDALSRKTLGQLLRELCKVADVGPDVQVPLEAGLEARNFVIHRFAQHVGDDLTDEDKVAEHERTLYQKCSTIMGANDAALAMLHAVGELQSKQSAARVAELRHTAAALQELARYLPKSTH